MSILVVGSVAYDSVATPAGKVEEALGGSATYFSVAASFFTPVWLVACVGRDFRPQDRYFLESRGIDLAGLQTLEGETFRWKGRYGENLDEAETLATHLNVFAEFKPELPSRYRSAEFVFLANIDPVLQRRVLAQVRAPRLVAADTMNYWIEGSFSELLETLRLVHVLVINEGEARQLSQEKSLVRAARKIMGWGPRAVVIKRGGAGVLVFSGGRGELDVFGLPAFPLDKVVDPTGAGDTFAGGFMGFLAGTGRTDPMALRQAAVFGSVMASFNVESFSLERLRTLTFPEVTERYKQFERLAFFEPLPDLAGRQGTAETV
ncbi:MAG: PfkB family carbohydrate kinase [Acidobacteriota bacterium]